MTILRTSQKLRTLPKRKTKKKKKIRIHKVRVNLKKKLKMKQPLAPHTMIPIWKMTKQQQTKQPHPPRIKSNLLNPRIRQLLVKRITRIARKRKILIKLRTTSLVSNTRTTMNLWTKMKMKNKRMRKKRQMS